MFQGKIPQVLQTCARTLAGVAFLGGLYESSLSPLALSDMSLFLPGRMQPGGCAIRLLLHLPFITQKCICCCRIVCMHETLPALLLASGVLH